MTTQALKSNQANSFAMKGTRSGLFRKVPETSAAQLEMLKAWIARLMGFKDVFPGRWYL